jgi:hypothetical protein
LTIDVALVTVRNPYGTDGQDGMDEAGVEDVEYEADVGDVLDG